MSTKRYTDKFKVEAVNHVLDRGYRVDKVAERLGVSPHSLHQWINKRRKGAAPRAAQLPPTEELRRLKAELKRDTEERDILKKGRRVLCQAVRVKYGFIAQETRHYSVRRLCKVMAVHPSGLYAWRQQPKSERQRDDERLCGLLKQAWLESGGLYGYRKLTLDMRGLGEP